MSRYLVLIACIFPLLCSAQQPLAQPPAVKKDEVPKVEKIEVQGDSLSERRESTASKLIINSEEIVKYGDTNLHGG